MHLTFRRKTWQTPQRFDQAQPKQAEEARQAARSHRHDDCLQELGEGAQYLRTWPGVSFESRETLSKDTNRVSRWGGEGGSRDDVPRRLTGYVRVASADEGNLRLNRTDAPLKSVFKAQLKANQAQIFLTGEA